MKTYLLIAAILSVPAVAHAGYDMPLTQAVIVQYGLSESNSTETYQVIAMRGRRRSARGYKNIHTKPAQKGTNKPARKGRSTRSIRSFSR